MTALIKNALLKSISVDWVPTVLTGQGAAMIPNALMVRVIVMITKIVKEHSHVALIIVQQGLWAWIAAHTMVLNADKGVCS